MVRLFPDDYEEEYNFDTSPAFNTSEVEGVNSYLRKHIDEIELESRFDADLAKLQIFLEKLRRDGVIVEG